ncbi:hypothetical protein CUU64_17715 [Bacillus sp. V5-8f]|nr:hypothetical protein CUU64_17715 [Bacillus sp. V5-8f]
MFLDESLVSYHAPLNFFLPVQAFALVLMLVFPAPRIWDTRYEGNEDRLKNTKPQEEKTVKSILLGIPHLNYLG